MAARMTPKEILRALNESARAGRIDELAFLEKHFIPADGTIRRPIRFEPWQVEHVLAPVIRKVNRQRRYDTYLIGLPKQNGKSTLAACVGMYALLLDDPNPAVYSCAGDEDQARIIFRAAKQSFENSPAVRQLVRIYKDSIERVDGAGCYRVLAADASGSHGLNPSCVIWDELWNQPNWDLWEALTHSPVRENPFHFVVTYSGYQARSGNLLWDLYSRGMTGEDPKQYTFWRSGPHANLASWVTPEYLESQRRRLPDHIFRRLHYNEWSVADSTKVFRLPPECYQGTFEDFVPGGVYAAGIDLAKFRDFTAWAIIRRDVQPFRLVDFGKLPHIDYTTQVELLEAKLKRFGNPNALVDDGAAGEPVIELMRKCGLNVEEFRFTNDSKARIVTDLAVGFEQRQINLPASGRTLDESRAIQDLEAEMFHFEPKVLDSGNLRYGGKGAYHDDLVIALCLAYAGAKYVPREPICEFIEFDPIAAYGDPRERRCKWYPSG